MRSSYCLGILTVVTGALFGCGQGPASQNRLTPNTAAATLQPLPQQATFPASNSYSPERAALGKQLFWDPVLSENQDIACATCHHPDNGFTDPLRRSLGTGGIGLGLNRFGGVQGDRNSMSLLNVAFNGLTEAGIPAPETAPMFWDSRTHSLEDQVEGPIVNDREMLGQHFTPTTIQGELEQRLNQIPEYQARFLEAYGTSEVSFPLIQQAIAVYERTLITPNSRLDAYLRGDAQALTSFEQEGLNRFVRVGCAECHSGPMLSDYQLHTLSVPELNRSTADAGAGAFNFRTPSLRNLSFTAPYMHNGRFDRLEDVLDFYRRLRRGRSQNPNVRSSELSPQLAQLNLRDNDIPFILAFLRTLDDGSFDQSIPSSVPSGLPVGGRIE